MRPIVSLLAASAFLAVVVTAPAGAAIPTTEIAIDHSMRIALAGDVANVLVGNSQIADVAVVDRRSLVLTGKGFGSTNLIVLDAAGHTLLEREVQVSPVPADRVTLLRGPAATAYSCTQGCQPIGAAANGGSAAASSPAVASSPTPGTP